MFLTEASILAPRVFVVWEHDLKGQHSAVAAEKPTASLSPAIFGIHTDRTHIQNQEPCAAICNIDPFSRRLFLCV